MLVYTYYDKAVGQQGQEEMLSLWAESWKRHGWSPVVLQPKHATAHRAYNDFRNKIWRLPTVNDRTYEEACYLRWLALAAYKRCGWMTDYDVINNGFRPRQPKWPVEMLDCTYVPCAVGTLERGPDVIVKMIMSYEHPPGSDHCSDMLIFKTKFDRQEFGPPGKEVAEFGVDGWRTAPLIHFSAGKAGPYKARAVREHAPCFKTQTKKR